MTSEQSDSKSPHVRKLAEQARDYQPTEQYPHQQVEDQEYNFLEQIVDTLFHLVEVGESVILEIKSSFHDDFENGVSAVSEVFGSDYIKKRYEKKGERLLRRFITNNPDDERVAEAHYNLARLLYGRKGKEKETFEHCKKAIELDRTHHEAHNFFESCGEKIGYDLEGYFQEAVSSNPDYKLGYSYLGFLHINKDPEKAIEYYKKASDDFHTHLFLSRLYAEKGLEKEEFSELAQISDYHIISILNSIIHKHLNDMSFVDICEHTIKSHPEKISPYKYLAWGYCAKEMFDEALQTYRRALEIAPNNPEIFWGMVRTYYRSGNLEKAVESCSKILDIKGYRDSGLYALGVMYYDNGDYQEALRAWKKIHRRTEFCTEGSGDLWWGDIIKRKDLIKDAKDKKRK